MGLRTEEWGGGEVGLVSSMEVVDKDDTGESGKVSEAFGKSREHFS